MLSEQCVDSYSFVILDLWNLFCLCNAYDILNFTVKVDFSKHIYTFRKSILYDLLG